MAVWTDGVDRMDNMYRMEWIGSYRIELQRQVIFSKRMTSLFLSILSNSNCTYERCKYVQRVHTGIEFSPEQLNSVPARLLCTTVLLTVTEVLNHGTPVSTAHITRIKKYSFFMLLGSKRLWHDFLKQKLGIVYLLQ